MATKTKEKVKVNDVVVPLTSFIETGCIGLDLALSNGKGIPEGGNILLFAMPGSGKTTLIADILRRLLKKYEAIGIPYRAVYIDSENSNVLLNCMGKDANDEQGLSKYITNAEVGRPVEYKEHQLIYYPNINLFSQAEEIFAKYTLEDEEKENQDVRIIIVDSLTNLTSTTLAEVAVDKADFGSNAKERTRFYGKWLSKTRGKNITTIYTSQVRQKQNATAYEDPNRPAVTQADEHNMDVIMKLMKSTDSKRVPLKKVKQKTIDGVVERQTRYILKLSSKGPAHTKNRIWDAVDVDILVKPGCKILNAYTLFNMLEMNNLYKRVNATTFTVSDELRVAFPDVDFGDDKGIAKKDLNVITSVNRGRFVEYLKTNNLYSAVVGEIEDLDDGLTD